MQSRDANARNPASPDAAPAELGGYRLVELLGRGGMGEVWRAEREGPGGIRRRAAVKRILPRLQSDPNLRQRFLAEARTNARLEHPNIVQVLDFGDQPEPYLVLEYVEGISAADLLRDMIRSNAKLPAVAASFIIAEAASGLDYAHRRRDEDGRPLQIIHRDVTPQNLLVSIDGAVKLSDFGVARAADNTFRTQEGMSVGKLGYLAPEQVAGKPFDARVDIFALGVTFWEMLTLQPLIPREDPNAAMKMLLQDEIPPPSRVDPRLPAALDQIVMTALARDPNARYATAGAMAQAIRAFVHGISPGFDSTELVRILGRLMPSVAFHGTTPPPRDASAAAMVPAAPVAARLEFSAPHVGQRPPSNPGNAAAPGGQGQPPMQSPGFGGPMPVAQNAPPRNAFAQPAQQQQQQQQQHQHQHQHQHQQQQSREQQQPHHPQQGPHALSGLGAGGFRPQYAQAPNAQPGFAPVIAPSHPSQMPVTQARPMGLIVGLAVVGFGIIAGAAVVIVNSRSASSEPAAANTASAMQPPTTSLGPMNTWPAQPGQGGSLPPLGMGRHPGIDEPSQAPPSIQPTGPAQHAPSQQQAPQPSRSHGSGGSAGSGGHAVASPERQAFSDNIRRELAPLRRMIRACLGIEEGSGARIRVTVSYDGSHPLTTRVDSEGFGTALAPNGAECVTQLVRSSVHTQGMNIPLSVREDFEY